MNSISTGYAFLALAICSEVLGTAFLAKSAQFTRLIPTFITIGCYLISFYSLAQCLKTIQLGIAYAIWGGLGIVLTAMVGALVFKQTPDLPAVIGISMIVGGVVVINIFSNSVGS
jgi:small multidrug resistance pump